MTRSRSSGLADFDPDPEKTVRKNLRKIKEILHNSPPRSRREGVESSRMDNNPIVPPRADEAVEPLNVDPALIGNGVNPPVAPRTMMDYCRPNLDGASTSIARPRVQANTFEIKPSIIQMLQQSVQFDGFNDEDPNTHLQQFLEICDTFKISGVSEDAIRLQLFPFTLRSNAKQWLNVMPRNSINTWQEMAELFMKKYFPPSRTAKLRADVSSFAQMDSETLYEAWERWKELLRKCPHHGLPEWHQV